MKFIIIIFLMIRLNYCYKFFIVENQTKCTDNAQKIQLNNNIVTTTQFTISLWVRLTYYHNSTAKPFLKLKNINTNTEILLTSTKNTGSYTYSLKYLSYSLGNINHSNTPLNTLEEQDFLTSNNYYSNWNFIGISFLKSNSRIITYVEGSSAFLSSEYSLVDNHEISDLILYPCLSIDMNNLGGLYFSEITIYDQMSNTSNLFENVKQMMGRVNAIYLFTENSRKNSLFIPNSLNNNFGPLKVVTNSPEFPFRQDRNFYTLSMFQKLFKFKVDNIGVRDNSYIVICKLKIEKVKGSTFRFLFYGRANKNLDILNNSPDKVEIDITFKNQAFVFFGYCEYDINCKIDGILKKNYWSSFTGTVTINLSIKIKDQVGNDLPRVLKQQTFLSWYENNLEKDFWIGTTAYSNFLFDDQHYFGIPSTIKTDLAFFNILE